MLGNFTTHAGSYMDELKLPYPKDGIFEEELLRKHFADDVLFDVCNGREFWEGMPMYPWAWTLFEKATMLSKMDVYFLFEAHRADVGMWSGKASWIYKNFGQFGIQRVVGSMRDENLAMLCNGRKDILITCIKHQQENWNASGGTAILIPELDVRWVGCGQEVAKWMNAMTEVVASL